MSDVVVDSSVVAKWIVPEAGSAEALRLTSDVRRRGDALVVLDLAIVEVTNAIWRRHHQNLLSLPDARSRLGALQASPVRVEPAIRLLEPALDIALKYDRAVYDALFVALARDLGLPGVTADAPLVRAIHADFPEIVLLRDLFP